MSERNNTTVYLVGAGPGDPELLTLKGMRLIKEADVIVYDQLANPGFLQMAKPGARMIDVGKHAGNHTMPQEEINALLVKEAQTARCVVRLKGGDPFIFGRGGEEAQVLGEHGVRFEIVPGVTSASAVPAYAGIPVTHRSETTSVTFVTGHEARDGFDRIPFAQLAAMGGTTVFLMGLSNLHAITENLMKHGASPALPAAVISNGTKGNQQTVCGCLADIEEKVREAQVKTPAIIVTGTVVNLRNELKWFENKPLFGRRVIVTREISQASDFAERLTEAGAVPVICPLIRIEPAREEIERLSRMLEAELPFDWVVFTSANGVKLFMDTLENTGKDVRRLAGIKIAAIGEKTCETLKAYGLTADLMPSEYRAETLAQSLIDAADAGSRFLLARAYRGREVLARMLRDAGHTAEELSLYDTLTNTDIREELHAALRDADLITLASASAADALAELVPEETLKSLSRHADGTRKCGIAVIGPVTAKALEKHGIQADIMPDVYTTQHIIEDAGRWFEEPVGPEREET